MIKRYKHFASRRNAENVEKGWSVHYSFPEPYLRKHYSDIVNCCKKLQENDRT